MAKQGIPGVMERLQAVVLDGICIFFMMYLASGIFDRIGDVPDIAKIWVFVFVFFLYDPLFTSILGGTLGHRAMKLRVRRASNRSKNVFVLLAFVRFAIKAFLGWISLLFVSANSEGKALHDLAVGSVVIYKVEKDA
jgi:uncharacterized RDD family membrane protein YckC